MEIRYRLPLAEYQAIQRKISNHIYKNNKLLHRLRWYDIILFWPYLALVLFISFQIIDLQYILEDCYEINYSQWFAWFLLIGSCLILLYAIVLRPALVNKIFRSQVTDELADGEQVMRIQEDGLYLQNSLASSVYSYARIRDIKNIDNFLGIFLGNGYFVAVPHNAFTDETQRLTFENLLKSKLTTHENLPD